MKPLYKWVGGKSQEIKLFKELYPKKFDRYIEPFFGGGSVFFDLENEKNVINDTNEEVINFLQLIKNGMSKEIYDGMSKLSNDEKTYYEVRDSNPTTGLEIAIRFYYLRKTCFRGLVRYNKDGRFNASFGHYKKYSFEELLDPKYEKILKSTEILKLDFSDMLKVYDNDNDFCFLDPPYHNTFDRYDSNGFSDEDHIKLSKLFKLSKMKCLMIIGRTDFIEDLYKDYLFASYDKKYVITTHVKEVNKSNHLVIKNF